ncbi:fumarylacetoacetate hydrolase family protein [Nonomuraea sp. NEAU-A123]|uniref:fumarylacetoacetate hydrolase family protein n=1 Tax=Nonomuraea sp. NEAU-A123 TaxID=2839649 RepID=UPI002032F281|nr:fumarylacetoacetate hydrolase family protein [Nonomuraea sp. NEAU-A123]
MCAFSFENTPADGFALARFAVAGRPVVGVVVDGTAYPLGAAPAPEYASVTSIEELLPEWDTHVDRLHAWAGRLRAGSVATLPITTGTADVLAPTRPAGIFQAAANYRKHVVDLMVASPRPEHRDLTEPERRAFATRMMDERAASGTPTVFCGLPSSLSGPYDDVVIPHITEQCDWELELAAVIGRPARYVSRDSALEFVAGYTIVNDITMRDRLYPSGDSARGPDWLACKGAPTFLPVGPLVVPARYVPDPMALTITLRLNDVVMQHEATADMIFDLPRLIEHASRYARLLPGDLLLTGSPAGNGVHHGRFLQDGDVMEGRITGLGVQRTPAVAERRASAT